MKITIKITPDEIKKLKKEPCSDNKTLIINHVVSEIVDRKNTAIDEIRKLLK